MDLILSTFGTALTKDNDCFVVVNKDGKRRIAPSDVRSIQIHRGTQISSDAALLAIEHEVEVLFVDKGGRPIGRVWSNRYGSISTIRKGQLEFAQSPAAMRWIVDEIAFKIENQQALLSTFGSADDEHRPSTDRAVLRLETYHRKLKALTGDHVAEVAAQLRGWEGIVSKIYFEQMNTFLPERYRFGERTQHPAMDVANALLNYGYGMLYGKVEGALIRAGIDPYIGVLHRDEYNRPVLVYDVIERYRVWVDYVVWTLLRQCVVGEEYFSHRADGSCWLEGLGRRVLIQSLNDYLAEIVSIGRLERSRLTHIDLQAQALAQKFKS
ncbi:MAG: CRISPR-associated endonuclease Cas1 [Mediterranea sp.]|jgi:CRISPR-associated protein Cas1|nr:CRISPR-associated endonuclease Cas1 [Mediterranea sp.]